MCFACTWAFLLFAIYAWIDGRVWAEYRALLWYGLGAAVLYWLHLGVTVRREWRGRARHDSHAGTPHLGWLLRGLGKESSIRLVQVCSLWVEPALVLAASLSLSVLAGERHLARWLLFTGGCLWIKEALNCWFSLRRHKRQQDMLEDAEAALVEPPSPHLADNDPLRPTRKPKVDRVRTI